MAGVRLGLMMKNEIGYLQLLVASEFLVKQQKHYDDINRKLSEGATREWKKLHDGLDRRFNENSSG